MKLCQSCKNAFHGVPPKCPVCQTDLSREPDVSERDLVGMVVGEKYVLAELLGEGAMGTVYRAVHRELDRSVAVKLLKAGSDGHQDAVRRFEHEARTVSRLHHPHIVSVIDFGQTPGGTLYLVTEYIEGDTLASLIDRPELLPIARTIDIFHQILAAVEEAHSAQVIHRDLKPDNIVVMPLRAGSDFVKVLDFGIATIGGEARPSDTRSGGFVGTPGYMAPETIEEGRADERSDIYALGSVLFEMLTGRAVFVHEMPLALLSLHLQDEPPSLREAAPLQRYPEELEEVVSRALAKKPGERFASVAELRAALTRATVALGQQRLKCNACTRPLDPDTGLCSLHGQAATTAVAPASRRSVDPASQTLVGREAVDPVALVRRALGDAVGREQEAEAAGDFLLGNKSLLEVVGEPGSGRTTLLAAVGNAAESMGYEVHRLRRDPRRALRPWYPVRHLVGGLLGIGARPATMDGVRKAAERLGMGTDTWTGLLLLFGFRVREAPPSRPERMTLIQAAAFGALAAAGTGAGGTCVLADDALDYDRASQSFVHYLALRMGELGGKLVLGVDSDFWPNGRQRSVARLRPFHAAEVRGLLAAQLSGGTFDRALLARRIVEVSGGNAFHVTQAIRGYVEGTAGARPVKEVVARRLESLPEAAVAVLRVLCALGADVHPDELERHAGGNEPAAHLEALTDAGFVQRSADGLLSPAHPTLARTVLGCLPIPERSQLHARLLAELASTRHSVFQRAHHAHEAGLDHEAFELLTAAGDAACAWTDEETAGLVHYQRAVQVARWKLLLGEDDEAFLELSLNLATALLAAGHLRAAEVVFKEVLGYADHSTGIRERAQTGLDLALGS